MSNENDMAFRQWCKDNGIRPSHDAMPLFYKCWQDAYAAASADTERLVRAAVEAMREEAAKAVGTLWMRSQLGKEAQTASMKCVRAIDIDAIVARVMQSKEQS